jgi:hypothetical protein
MTAFGPEKRGARYEILFSKELVLGVVRRGLSPVLKTPS